MLLIAGLSFAASAWDGKDPDVKADALLSAPPEAVYAVLTDLRALRAATPTACVGRWEYGSKVVGPGATSIVRYDIAGMHRTLVMTLSSAEPTWKVDFDHAGQTGFITQWTITLESSGTRVAVTTLIEAPPWPFKAYYFETVQPDWQWCEQQTLAGVARLAAAWPNVPGAETGSGLLPYTPPEAARPAAPPPPAPEPVPETPTPAPAPPTPTPTPG